MYKEERELVYQTLELLRKTTKEKWDLYDFKDHDQKDVDDYIFSALDWPKQFLIDLYEEHGNSNVYLGSAYEGE